MKMSKTCQRLNEKLLAVLAQINDAAQQVEGYQHLSHTVEFDCFPGSLLVLCHFENKQFLAEALESGTEKSLQKLLHKYLLKKGIVLKNSAMNLKLTVA